MNTQDFINKSKEVHGDEYDYSLSYFTDRYNKLIIKCTEHGEFMQQAQLHLVGQGCSKCGHKNNRTTEEFIEKCSDIHNDYYDYSLVDYVNAKTKVTIICPEQGIFKQLPINHNRGRGCGNCKRKNNPSIT